MALYRIALFPHQGRGLQATKLIPRGTIIIRSPVVVVPQSEIRANGVLAHYVFKFGNKVAIALGDASLINHSSPGNCDYYPDVGRRQIIVRANQVIKPGQQLSIDYGWNEPHFMQIGDKMPKGKFKVKAASEPLRALANRLAITLGNTEQAASSEKELPSFKMRQAAEKEPSPLHDTFTKHGLQHRYTLENDHGDKQYYYGVPPGETRPLRSDVARDLHNSDHRLDASQQEIRHHGADISPTVHSHYIKGNSHVTTFSSGPEGRVSGVRHHVRKLKWSKSMTEMARDRPRLRILKEAHDHKFATETFRRYVHQKDFSLFPEFQRDLDDLISTYRGQGLPVVEDRVSNGREREPTTQERHVMNPVDIITQSPSVPQTAIALAHFLHVKK